MATARKLELSIPTTDSQVVSTRHYHFNKNLSRESKSALSQKLTQTTDNHTELQPARPANHEYRISGSTPHSSLPEERLLVRFLSNFIPRSMSAFLYTHIVRVAQEGGQLTGSRTETEVEYVVIAVTDRSKNRMRN